MALSLKRRLLEGGFWVFAGKLVTASSNLLVGALLARLLSTQDFGDYGLAFSVVTFGSLVSVLGLHQAMVRLVAESIGRGQPGRARASVSLAFRSVVLSIVVIAALLLFGGRAWLARGLWGSPAMGVALPAITAWLAVAGLQLLASETFRGFQDLRLASTFGGVISSALFAAVLAVLLGLDRTISLRAALWLGAGTAALSLACALWVLGRMVARLPAGESIGRKEVFSISLPLCASGVLAFALSWSALWIVGAYLPKEDLAHYYAALRLVTLVSTPLILVNLVVPPFIAELYAVGQRERLQRVLRATATFAGVPGFAVLLVFVLFGPWVLSLVYTPAYRGAAPILALLSVGYLINVWTGSCGVTLAMTGNQSTLVRAGLGSGVLSVGGTLLVVQRFGVQGVATVICAAMIVQNVWLWLAARYHTGLWTHATIPKLDDLRALLRLGSS